MIFFSFLEEADAFRFEHVASEKSRHVQHNLPLQKYIEIE